MIRYGVTIFLSAFLLFQVQPIIARFILPWFGGTAAVWTTCLMFFQMLLLLGYLYSHLLRKLCTPKQAWIVHVVLLGAAACFATIVPSESLQPDGSENLTVAIVTVLGITVGLPFFALSTTGPLVQAWQGSSHAGQSPYRLYALSNLGSMLALLSYPFLVERYLPLAYQAEVWHIAFLFFVSICVLSGFQTIRKDQWHPLGEESKSDPNVSEKIEAWQPIVWVVLAMAASIVLLATTNLMCQEVASVPFLWILPLSLYLLSFIICFDRPGLYRRSVFVPMLFVGALISIAIVHLNVLAGFGLQIIGLSLACFASSMICHGELERMKPSIANLTSFYLWVSVGGALGGIFVCVAAPNIFKHFCEFHVGIIICLLVALWTLYQFSKREDRSVSIVFLAVIGLSLSFVTALYATSLMYFLDSSYQDKVVYRGRNEYGLAAVEDVNDGSYRRFVNGSIEHGGQSLVEGQEFEHISYYVPGSGVGVAFESYREQEDGPIKVGVLGLGAGAMTTWVEKEDTLDFYEINPIVENIAKKYFTFLSDSPASISVVLGDGRIQLQNRLNEEGSAQYDLLFMDAFASDSIPVHLLTRECMQLYFKHVKDDGVVVAHITNRFIDLRPVILKHAEEFGIDPILIDFVSDDKKVETRWVLLTRNEAIINSEIVQQHRAAFPDDMEPVLWTDDYASVAALLNWSTKIDWGRIQSELDEGSERSQDVVNTRE